MMNHEASFRTLMVTGIFVMHIAVASESVSIADRPRSVVTTSVPVDTPVWVCWACFQRTVTPTFYAHYFQSEEMEEVLDPRAGEGQSVSSAGNGELSAGDTDAEFSTGVRRVMQRPEYFAPLRDEEIGSRDCREDIAGQQEEPSCHSPANTAPGECDAMHGPCEQSGEVVAALHDLRRVIASGSQSSLLSLVARAKGVLRYNRARSALQVLDCRGEVLAHVTIAGELAVVARRVAAVANTLLTR